MTEQVLEKNERAGVMLNPKDHFFAEKERCDEFLNLQEIPALTNEELAEHILFKWDTAVKNLDEINPFQPSNWQSMSELGDLPRLFKAISPGAKQEDRVHLVQYANRQSEKLIRAARFDPKNTIKYAASVAMWNATAQRYATVEERVRLI